MDSTRARCCHWHDTDESHIYMYMCIYVFLSLSPTLYLSSRSPFSFPRFDDTIVSDSAGGIACGVAAIKKQKKQKTVIHHVSRHARGEPINVCVRLVVNGMLRGLVVRMTL